MTPIIALCQVFCLLLSLPYSTALFHVPSKPFVPREKARSYHFALDETSINPNSAWAQRFNQPRAKKKSENRLPSHELDSDWRAKQLPVSQEAEFSANESSSGEISDLDQENHSSSPLPHSLRGQLQRGVGCAEKMKDSQNKKREGQKRKIDLEPSSDSVEQPRIPKERANTKQNSRNQPHVVDFNMCTYRGIRIKKNQAKADTT